AVEAAQPEATLTTAVARVRTTQWVCDEVAAGQRDASVRLAVTALASAWTPPRSRSVAGRDDLRPSLAQALLARDLVRAAGEHAAGLVAHVCAWVVPATHGTPVPEVHSPRACLALFEAW